MPEDIQNCNDLDAIALNQANPSLMPAHFWEFHE